MPAGAHSLDWFGGTPGFMASEQLLALEAIRDGRPIPRAVDNRSDLFSLGMVLYAALGGLPPAPGDRPRPLRHWNPAIRCGLSDILGKCLEPDPARRYPTGAALADDLRRQLTNQPLRGVGNRSLRERWQKWRRRSPFGLVVVMLAGSVFAALAALVIVAAANSSSRFQEARTAVEEGKVCIEQGRPDEADRLLSRGLERIAGWPWSGGLSGELEAERRQARGELFARALHKEADDLRFLRSPEAIAPDLAAKLADRCEQLWERRDKEGIPDTEQVRSDLLDLAVLGTHWRVRAASGSEKTAAQKRALAILDEAEQFNGSSTVLARECAEHLAALGDKQGARIAFHAARAAPQSAWEQYALGRALLDAGELDKAAAALEEAVRSRPGTFWPNFYQGVCAHRRGRLDEAVEAFRVCVALAPTSAPCYYNRGLVLAALGRAADARIDYDRSLDLDPKLAAARLARAALSLKQGHPTEAEADLHRALADGADPALVYFNLALVYHARNDHQAVRAALQTCLEHRPDYPEARAWLNRLKP